jgi:hypothetical protein
VHLSPEEQLAAAGTSERLDRGAAVQRITVSARGRRDQQGAGAPMDANGRGTRPTQFWLVETEPPAVREVIVPI